MKYYKICSYTTTTNYYYDDAGRLVRMEDRYDAVWFYYNPSGSAMSFKYHDTRYYYIKNAQDDVTAIVDPNGNIVAKYEYDSWGKVLAVTDADGNAKTSSSHIGNINPLRYRSYFFDTESEFYYLNSRYYDTYTRRFINADGQLNPQEGVTGYNLFQYCGNNPVNRIDPTGEAWWHWALGAAVVAACAVATVVTCGGFAAAAGAVDAVGSGVAAATTASTIAAGAFIGSVTVYGMAVVSAASTSSSVKEFNDKGNWGTVAATAGGAVVGGKVEQGETKEQVLVRECQEELAVKLKVFHRNWSITISSGSRRVRYQTMISAQRIKRY